MPLELFLTILFCGDALRVTHAVQVDNKKKRIAIFAMADIYNRTSQEAVDVASEDFNLISYG